MEFQRERVYTALNADELKQGDKVIVARSLSLLKTAIENTDDPQLTAQLQEMERMMKHGI